MAYIPSPQAIARPTPKPRNKLTAEEGVMLYTSLLKSGFMNWSGIHPTRMNDGLIFGRPLNDFSREALLAVIDGDFTTCESEFIRADREGDGYTPEESEIWTDDDVETQRTQAGLENAISECGISLAEIRAIESGKGVLFSRPLNTYSPAEMKALENIKSDNHWIKEFGRIRKIAEEKLAEINRQSRAKHIDARKAQMNKGILARLFGRKTVGAGAR